MGYRPCPAAFFTVLTLSTIGATTAAVVGVYIWMVLEDFPAIYATLRVVWICLIVASVVFFCFGVYASCCGERCARGLLGCVYLLYALGCLALMVVVLADRRGVVAFLDRASRFWTDPADSATAAGVEDDLGCLCWNQSACLNATDECGAPGGAECCQTVIERAFDDSRSVIAAVAGVAALVMAAGTAGAWVSARRPPETRVVSLLDTYDNYA
jgi:hypothetical protein